MASINFILIFVKLLKSDFLTSHYGIEYSLWCCIFCKTHYLYLYIFDCIHENYEKPSDIIILGPPYFTVFTAYNIIFKLQPFGYMRIYQERNVSWTAKF